eukprot:TRINITY_DN32085_c0_g1_i1.p1 TRINITY_DN32085_c0_g1~~TRINITY_DN32085_c0_g1_i1.p1  ORF type:complete len:470 (+),score=96.40 TRINITY_DN32085_c0_g1_i1:25-1410(+)
MAATGSSAGKPKGGEALVCFTTKLKGQYEVPEEELVLPSNLARYGLSEVVNRLLSLDPPVPFDFLVEGEFLRTTIAGYLEANKLSSEKILRLEYVLALREPEQSTVDETPDWIAGVVALQGFPSPCFAAVSYDGTLRVYRGSSSQLTVRLADAGLAGIAALSIDDGKSSHVAVPCQDGSLRCCRLELGQGEKGVIKAGSPAALLSARPQALEAAALSEDGTLLASAGWEQEICVWNADSDLFASPDGAATGGKRKSLPNGEAKKAKFSLKGHSQVLTCLRFGERSRFPFTLISGSWDCSLRVWDIAAASCVCNWSVARAVTSFSLNPEMPPQLATTHEDGHVSLWDIRAPPHSATTGALSLDASAGLPLLHAQTPHGRLASQVVWSPQDANRLASVGHDGRLCILDPRSPKMPLQTVQVGRQGPMPNKLLCAAWLAPDALAVGGSDGKVVRVSLALASDER